MMSKVSSRREFSLRVASVCSLLGFSGLPLLISPASASAESEEISNNAEAIHQEVVFKAAPDHVYKALTDSGQFSKITELSMPGATAHISGQAGGAFSLFKGHVTGRHIELVPNQRIVQAWRDDGWAPGVYSIAKFELHDSGSGTKLVFDHTGFPRGSAAHLAIGWKSHYWEPMEKYLEHSK
jgi:uncharacterized protein YndB with AHSA1/START domain